MHIEIDTDLVEIRTVGDNTFREQQALLWKDGDRYPDKFIIGLRRDQDAIPKGTYRLGDAAFSPDRYGKLGLVRDLASTMERMTEAEVKKLASV